MTASIPFLFRSRRHLGALALLLVASTPAPAENLIANGGFDHKDGDLTGWITDYAFSGNSHYVGNKDRVSVVGHKAVLKPAGDAGAKMETTPIVLEPGFKYTATLDAKGGPYRIYFAGYKWKPGIRPHESPELGELRMVYKSKAIAAKEGAGKKQTLELPGIALSSQAKGALKEVRFITLYVWMMKEGSIDNVTITKTPDPEMKF
jgi:hypothetical protein